MRDGWRQGQTAILTQLLLTIERCVIFKNPLSTSSASWLKLLNRGSLGATALSRGILSLQAGLHSCCCIVTTNYTYIYIYIYICGYIFNTITTSGHTSFEKYTSHFIRKGYERVIVWEVNWRLNKDCNILTPALLAILALLSCSPGLLKRRLVGPAFAKTWFSLLGLQQLTPNSDLQLTDVLSHPGYIIVWHPPTSCVVTIRTQFNPSIVKVISWYLRPDAPVIYTGAFLIWLLGRIRGQYVTLCSNWLNGHRHLPIFFHNAHLLPIFVRLFTQLHLWLTARSKVNIQQIDIWNLRNHIYFPSYGNRLIIEINDMLISLRSWFIIFQKLQSS